MSAANVAGGREAAAPFPRGPTAVPGVRIGHAGDEALGTGVTVALFDRPVAAAAYVGGAASGTRQFGALAPDHVAAAVDAIVFAGGSAFGLGAADGVMAFLRGQGRGFQTSAGRVPIVPTAILYDLACGAFAWPDAAMAERAVAAAHDGPVAEGSVGAGTGATVGKLAGIGHAMKGGVGCDAERIAGGPTVGVLVALNAFGDVCDPASGRIVAGARTPAGTFLDTAAAIRNGALAGLGATIENTTLTLVVTDARLSRLALARVAAQTTLALGRTIVPHNTPFDGDLVVAASCGDVRADPVQVGLMAGGLAERAVLRAVAAAHGLHGVPALRELPAP